MEKIFLNGNWKLIDIKICKTISAVVPGEIHIDLQRNGIIEEPFYGRNLEEIRKYEGKDWEYLKEFDVDEKLIKNSKRIELVFEGIDNYGEIFFNDIKVCETKNSFIPYTINVTSLIKRKNKIKVKINDGFSLVPDKIPEKYLSFRGDKEREVFGRIFLRKPQFVFGWDWTERIITCGMWKDVYLNFYENFCIRDVWIRNWNEKEIKVVLEVENFSEKNIKTEFEFLLEGKKNLFKLEISPGENIIDFIVPLPYLKLWYPRTIGEPFLYKMKIKAITEKIEDEKEIKFGLRNVEVIQEDDGDGKSFIFSVNGKKVFCKGANWVPCDTIFPRIDKKKYEKLIKYAVEENFNMLRIWGGGIYEDEFFYNLCDENGIMIWHDFMFACAYYPDDDSIFMKNIEEEIEKIVKRLRNHPSIVLWCGNNENYTIYYYEKQKNPEKVFYGKRIFEEFIPEKLKSIDPERFYWPSSDYSPSGDDPKSMKEGDRHSWYIPNINLEQYYKKGERYFFLQDTAKFISEFGRIAFSPYKTILNFIENKKIDFSDPDFLFHSNTYGRPYEIVENLKNFYGERIKNLKQEDIVKISQLHQGSAIEFALKYYGSRKYKTAGALFWMFDDSWPTSSSWVVVDWYLNKTPLFYFVKRAFEDVYLFINPLFLIDGNSYSIYVVNNRLNEYQIPIVYGISDFYGNKIFEESKIIKLKSDQVIEVKNGKIPKDLKNKENYFLYVYSDYQKFIFDICLLCEDLKKLKLPESEINYKFQGKEMVLKSKDFHICVEVAGTRENYFPLLPEKEFKVEIEERIKPISWNYLFL